MEDKSLTDVVLQGRLVKMRLLKPKDAEITFAWRNSQRAQYLNRGATDVESQRRWIINSENNGDLNFVIEYKKTPVGMLSLCDINPRNHSFIMGRELLGEPEIIGNAPVVFESEILILDYAFEKLGMHSSYGDVMGTNTGMLKMRRFLRWNRSGIFKEHFFVNGEYVDAVLFSLLKDDYYSTTRKIMQSMVDMYLKNSEGV